ncbi:hypothetical protein ABT337_25565 [Saccharopolyspora hirsuta]|uniref:hypothetical protein n=1 Tax=Saccharopolyspora hirsuta TaxID=1837 RepID=UPI003320E679
MRKLLRRARSKADYTWFLAVREWPVLVSALGVLLGAITILPSAVGVAISVIALLLGTATFVRDFRNLRQRWSSHEFSLIAAPFPHEQLPPPAAYPDAAYSYLPNRGTALLSDEIDRTLRDRTFTVRLADEPYRLPPILRATAPHVLPIRADPRSPEPSPGDPRRRLPPAPPGPPRCRPVLPRCAAMNPIADRKRPAGRQRVPAAAPSRPAEPDPGRGRTRADRLPRGRCRANPNLARRDRRIGPHHRGRARGHGADRVGLAENGLGEACEKWLEQVAAGEDPWLDPLAGVMLSFETACHFEYLSRPALADIGLHLFPAGADFEPVHAAWTG